MATPFPEPTSPVTSRTEVLLGYLDHFRSVLVDKLRALPEQALRTSALPSGWTPLELVNHLTYVERRWLVWGFEGTQVGEPWGDSRDDRWYVDPTLTLADLVTALQEQGRTTRAVALRHGLDERGLPGERWDGEPPATLERVLLHLLQEHARHLGHLDVVVELATRW